MDEYTRALRLVVRLQQPFHALLLQQQPNGEFRRVAAEHEIVIPESNVRINLQRICVLKSWRYCDMGMTFYHIVLF
ncbi:hypothetical protein L210DRAFT_2534716 [Boletus edulis BED1]|uniref:Uncharacterized protein n=1 Tax=Boletus edulis BED1 TaxID=1328754 RepID=A0AAD4BBD5_BOLED|nr:hypothetical protein L210DRAFT_2534716 [Boletus edulis BED1]